jgi:hypothetical protein
VGFQRYDAVCLMRNGRPGAPDSLRRGTPWLNQSTSHEPAAMTLRYQSALSFGIRCCVA